MTHQKDYNLSSYLTEELITNGLSGVPELIKIMSDKKSLSMATTFGVFSSRIFSSVTLIMAASISIA